MSVTFLDKEFESQMKNRILPLMRINLEEGYFRLMMGQRSIMDILNNQMPKRLS